jgi:hypothetical protein
MSKIRSDREPESYEFRVGRHLDDHWAEWLGNLTLTRESDGTTTLRGPVTDQAALHGLLIKIRDLGMILLSVRAIDWPTDVAAPFEPEDKESAMETSENTPSVDANAEVIR